MKNQNERQQFVEKVRKMSKSVRHFEGFDSAMIYSIVNRVEEHVNNLNDIKLSVCTNSLTKLKKMTNSKLITHYSKDNEKGIKLKKQEIIPIWGFPTLGKHVSIAEVNNEGREILFRTRISPEFDPNKIYILLIKSTFNNNKIIQEGKENYKIINTYDEMLELVLIKSDIKSNNKL